MSPALDVRGLRKAYGELKAVDGVDISIKPGECFALLGPNGAGKTTTVEMLEGLLAPDSGEISIFGKSLRKNREDILQRVGVLLQETNLYKKLTVKETLTLFASFFKQSLTPNEIIEQLDLSEKADTRLEHLSGGQKQRVYLGCALINKPELVFLDEPTTGLDPQARRMIWGLLEKLKKENRSLFLTTHYMDEAESLADRVAIMDKGKIIAEGSPKKLVQEICGEQLLWVSFDTRAKQEWNIKKSLSEKLPWFDQAVKQDEGFEVMTGKADRHIPELTDVAKSLGMNIDSLRMRSCTLEDVFLKLTGRSIRDA